MVGIRPAVPDDAPDIARVHDTALRVRARDHYTEEQLEAMAPSGRDPSTVDGAVLDRPDRYVAVAESDGRIVGVGGVHLDEARLLGVFVHPDRGGEGIGRALLGDVESRAREAGLDAVTVFGALNAAGFYEACGFERVGRASGGAGGPLGAYDTGDAGIPAVELRKEL